MTVQELERKLELEIKRQQAEIIRLQDQIIQLLLERARGAEPIRVGPNPEDSTPGELGPERLAEIDREAARMVGEVTPCILSQVQ